MRKPKPLTSIEPDAESDRVEDKGMPVALPGPSSDPATNLLIADVVIRSISRIARDSAKKSLLRTRYSKDRARELVDQGSIGKTLLLYGASRIATRSLPGAVFIGGALLAKSALDRSKSRTRKLRNKRAVERLGPNPEAELLQEEN